MTAMPVLYHKSKTGKIYSWQVWTQGPVIHTQHGQVDGEQQSTTKRATPKNVGKANETSAPFQAEQEARSMWQKKRDKKYRESIDEVENQIILLPMLAKDFAKRKDKVTYPQDIQPKLDGVRCLAYWKDDQIFLMSRGAKEYTCPHITAELRTTLPKTYVFDGELYAHNVPFQTMMSWVKRLQDDTIKLKYHVYDVIDWEDLEAPWSSRHQKLEFLFGILTNLTNHVKIVNTEQAASEEDVHRIQSEYLSEGYEGAILRGPKGKYVIGGRSSDLLKVKTFQDDEFKVIGYKDGRGKFESCVIWECVTIGGEEFEVVPRGTFEEKKQWFKDGDDYIGKMFKVQYFGYSEEGKPRFPTGIGFRLEEDM